VCVFVRQKKTLTKIWGVDVKGRGWYLLKKCSTYWQNPLEDRKRDGALGNALYAGISI
jgi:hypothetical protein